MERTRICAIEVWCEALGGDVRFFRKSDAAEINGVLGGIEGWKRSDRAMRIGAEYGVQRGFIRA